MKGFAGAGYTPLAVASQAVNGANYIFAANGKIVYPGSREYPALLRVFSPSGGPARVLKIQRLGVPGASGAFGPFHETTGEEKAVLRKALSGLAGAGYEALLTSVQVVNGFNFQFIGTQTLAAASGDKYPVVFTVYQPPSGSPVFTGAQRVFDVV